MLPPCVAPKRVIMLTARIRDAGIDAMAMAMASKSRGR